MVVVGGGAIGEGKVEVVRALGADLVVVDPEPSPRLRDLAATGTLRLVERRWRPWHLRGAVLVIAATDDQRTNRHVGRWARRLGAVVNAVDDPQACDVTMPAVVRRGPVSIAISTGGASPAAARYLRERVNNALPTDVGAMVTTAAQLRTQLRHQGRYQYDYATWRDRLFTPWATHPVRDDLARSFEAKFPHRASKPEGRVTLVGAGPGDADLMTVRGVEALKTADVVLYDRLVDPVVLDLAPVAARRIPVGKAAGSGTAQERINELLVQHAATGVHVVRLKGGDPFVFGRGQEELEALAATGAHVEVIPGLSSVTSAPTLAGVTLTDRRHSASFSVITGHRAGPLDHDWDALARLGTIVVLMGAATAGAIATQLIGAGRPDNEPVAFVHRAGSSDQHVHRVDLTHMALHGCSFDAPTVIVIGAVAADHDGAQPADLVFPTQLS